MDTRTLTKHCSGDTCHCDWRLTIYGCDEETGAYIIYMITIGISAFVSVIGIGILFHRLVLKGHRLFEWGSGKGCLRPMPIDSMLFFLTFFNILRLLTSVLLVTDVNPENWIARSFMFEFAWQFGYGSFALYLIGIAQTLADSHKAISSGWLPSPRTVDAIGLTFFFTPFLLNNVCSLATGILAEKNLYVAEVFVHLLYALWFVHCFSLACAVMLSGWRLVRILNSHLKQFPTSGPRAISIKGGIFKIRAVVIIISFCLMSFASFLLLYGILRDRIMTSTVGNLILSAIWNWNAPLCTMAVEGALLFNPSSDENKNSFFGIKNSSSGENKFSGTPAKWTSTSGGMYDTHFSTFASGQDASFQGTLSHNAFDELKQQHLQYQRNFQQHQVKGHHQRYEEHRLEGPEDDDTDNKPNGDSSFSSTGASSVELTSAAVPASYSSPLPPTTIFTSEAGIPLEDVDYFEKSSKVRLI
ncbi:unnamed protein product [Absidia cylindrospora]